MVSRHAIANNHFIQSLMHPQKQPLMMNRTIVP